MSMTVVLHDGRRSCNVIHGFYYLSLFQLIILYCMMSELLNFFIIVCFYVFFFFFSSRRRHTRCSRDWSSDVCSSDLRAPTFFPFLFPSDFLLRSRRGMFSIPNINHDTFKSASPPWNEWRRKPQEIGRASCRERV